MTTQLKKSVKRKTNGHIRNGGRPRQLIVTLYTSDVIGIREQGRRQEEFISIESAYFYAIRNRMAVERMDKAKAKKAKRGGRDGR